MKNKKFLVPSILFVLTIIAYIAASLVFCYKTKPSVTTGEFPFSITYEYKGETATLEGIYKCEFSGSDTVLAEHNRYWDGESIIEYDGEYEIPNVIYRDETMSLGLFENMSAGYFMGDPLYADWYTNYGLEGPEPDVDYYDYVNEISLGDENVNDEELLEEIGFRIIEYTYPEPIENSFSLAGVHYSGDNVTIFVLLTLVFLLLCIIFVRKDKEYKYSSIDKLGIFFNFVVGIIAVPFITFICAFYEIISSEGLFSQIVFTIPPVSVICLALSVVFRRKEYKKTSMIIQFGGTALFVIFMFLESLFV